MTGVREVARSESAQDVAYGWLKRHVAAVPRDEGTFVTEAEVSQAVGLSRTPVREALLRLEAEGLVQIVPKKGAFVPPVSDADVEAVMQARGLVEDWCVRRVGPVADPLSAELRRLVERQRQLQDSPLAFIECDRQFHRTIVVAAGNPVLAGFYETLRDRQLRMGMRAVASSSQRVGVVLAEHQAIVDAVASGDTSVAASAVAAHLTSSLAAQHLPTRRWALAVTGAAPGMAP